MPYGWEVADITDDVRDAVVKLYTFGTDLVTKLQWAGTPISRVWMLP